MYSWYHGPYLLGFISAEVQIFPSVHANSICCEFILTLSHCPQRVIFEHAFRSLSYHRARVNATGIRIISSSHQTLVCTDSKLHASVSQGSSASRSRWGNQNMTVHPFGETALFKDVVGLDLEGHANR